MEKRGEIISSRNYRLPRLNRNAGKRDQPPHPCFGRRVLPILANFVERQTVAPCADFADSHEQTTAGIRPARHCNDYALTKRHLALEAGWPASAFAEDQ
jgi:hypothetical protein